MTDLNDNVLENNLQRNNIESTSAHYINQNAVVVTPRRNQEVGSIAPKPENDEGYKGLLDDLDPELIAKIVAKVAKKLKGSRFEKDEKENKFYGQFAKRNPKTYDGKEDLAFLEE